MIASPLVLSNLIYLAGAVAVAVFVSVIYVLWHRRPETVEDHMASFAKRLEALEALNQERDGLARRHGQATLPSRKGSARWDRRRSPTAPPRTAPTNDSLARSDRAPSQGRGQRPESHTG